MNRINLRILLAVWFILLSGCQPSTPSPQPADKEAEPTQLMQVPEETDLPIAALTETAVDANEAASVETDQPDGAVLPLEPISQRISASDGMVLDGQFYPAAAREAPLVVLFHWAPGDQTDWRMIASWLQNRGYQPEVPAEPQPWLDQSWFMSMPVDVTFHVLTFNFRGCKGGCESFDREGWLLDVEAVMDHIKILENVDISQVITLGASIGADGAAYGCHYFNETRGDCRGALSLSPGGYLTIPYPEEVDRLGGEVPPKPAWCLYSTGDQQSANACKGTDGENYRAISYSGSAHGMAIIEPGRDPDPLGVILEFMMQTDVCGDCP